MGKWTTVMVNARVKARKKMRSDVEHSGLSGLFVCTLCGGIERDSIVFKY